MHSGTRHQRRPLSAHQAHGTGAAAWPGSSPPSRASGRAPGAGVSPRRAELGLGSLRPEAERGSRRSIRRVPVGVPPTPLEPGQRLRVQVQLLRCPSVVPSSARPLLPDRGVLVGTTFPRPPLRRARPFLPGARRRPRRPRPRPRLLAPARGGAGEAGSAVLACDAARRGGLRRGVGLGIFTPSECSNTERRPCRPEI